MRLKRLTPSLIRGKSVLCRVTEDVQFVTQKDRRVVRDDTRLREILPTLHFLRKHRAKTFLLSWVGRPAGAHDAALTMDPVATRLSELLRVRVRKVNDCIGPLVERAATQMKPGDILQLENVRFHPEEDKRDKRFAKEFSRFTDVWVMDAFGQAHRDVASISLAPTYYKKRAAGFLLEKEVTQLNRALHTPKHPYAAIIGGAKIETKLPVMIALLKHADAMLIGGVLANTLLKAKGIQIGRSLADHTMMHLLKNFNLTDKRVHLPIDVIVEDAAGKRHERAVGAVQRNERILDIGPDTVELYRGVLQRAAMVLWNGPLGYFEDPTYAHGTRAIAEILGAIPAETILGGGETIDAVREAGVEKKMGFISTGGGAMLEFLTGKMLPGIKPLLV